MRKYNLTSEFHRHTACPTHRAGHTTLSIWWGSNAELWSLGENLAALWILLCLQQETGRILQNFLRFSPASGELIRKWTPQQVSHTSFPHFSPLLTQSSKTNALVCFYPLSKPPGLVHLWLKGAAIPVDEGMITQFLNHLFPRLLAHTFTLSTNGSTAASFLSA